MRVPRSYKTAGQAAQGIALRRSDRAVLVGANGTGKSTLANYLLSKFRDDYPESRILIIDTKPRWRGTTLANGSSPRRVYRDMVPGDVVDSMIISNMDDWQLAWSSANPSKTVVAQRITRDWQDRGTTQRETIQFCIDVMERFFATQKAKEPSLLYIDEGHDFFTSSGSARGSDIVQRCYRAGRERGMATMSAFQRPIGLNLQVLTELNYCALFRINFAKDVRRLWEMGWPQDIGPPGYSADHAFRLWREGSADAPMYRLNESMLKAS